MSTATKPAIVELLTRYFPQAVEFDDYSVVAGTGGTFHVTLCVPSTTGTKIWDFEERLRGLGLNRIHLSIMGVPDYQVAEGVGIKLYFTCFRT